METTKGPKVHNGCYTIQSPSGAHRTVEIKTQAADASFAPGKRIAQLMDGSSNEFSYHGFAWVDDQGLAIWSKRRDEQHQAVADILWSLALDASLSPWAEKGFRLLFEGTCVRCNRRLTTPESIKNGIGPDCAKRD